MGNNSTTTLRRTWISHCRCVGRFWRRIGTIALRLLSLNRCIVSYSTQLLRQSEVARPISVIVRQHCDICYSLNRFICYGYLFPYLLDKFIIFGKFFYISIGFRKMSKSSRKRNKICDKEMKVYMLSLIILFYGN